MDTLLKAENRDALTEVLTYHVVAGRASARKAMWRCSRKAEVFQSHGVIHVIGAVVLPN